MTRQTETRADHVTGALQDAGVVAIFRAPSAEHFVSTAEALVDAGWAAIEITLTGAGSLDALATLSERLTPNAIVGAGTVLDADQAKRAIDSGARFLISPVFAADVAEVARDADIAYVPGVVTPTEVYTALRAGVSAVKLFPASVTGLRYIAELRGPFPGVRVMPTGGIRISEISDWLRGGAIAVGIGGELLGTSLIDGPDPELASRARHALDKVNEARQA